MLCFGPKQGAFEESGRRGALMTRVIGSAAVQATDPGKDTAGWRLIFFWNNRVAIDVGDKHRRGLEGQNTTRRDFRLDASLGIAADALALRTDVKCAERAELHGFATQQRLADFLECGVEDFARFGTRERRAATIDGFPQRGARQSIPGGAFSNHVNERNTVGHECFTRRAENALSD